MLALFFIHLSISYCNMMLFIHQNLDFTFDVYIAVQIHSSCTYFISKSFQETQLLVNSEDDIKKSLLDKGTIFELLPDTEIEEVQNKAKNILNENVASMCDEFLTYNIILKLKTSLKHNQEFCVNFISSKRINNKSNDREFFIEDPLTCSESFLNNIAPVSNKNEKYLKTNASTLDEKQLDPENELTKLHNCEDIEKLDHSLDRLKDYDKKNLKNQKKNPKPPQNNPNNQHFKYFIISLISLFILLIIYYFTKK